MTAQKIPPNDKVEILIVEDSPIQAELLRKTLVRQGYTVTIAKNGAEGLEQIRKRKPTLVISDIAMPVMDGYRMCREIKHDKMLNDIPVMLFTSLSEPEDVIRGLECGADNFIVKSCEEKYLLTRIEYLLINRRLRRDQRSVRIGIEIYYADKNYIIESDQHQILDMLMSTFEHAVQQNHELVRMQLELKTLNEQLEEKVKERTAALKRSEDALQKAYDDLRQTQQAVMQQERLRALGQMASGIVHDINNTLSPIVVYTDLLLTGEPSLGESTRRYLKNIRTAATDIGHIVARMREFYRQREEREPLFLVDLNPLVRQVLDLTRPRWRDIPQGNGVAVEMHTELDPGLPSVPGIESEIRGALTNLIFNAIDAMPQGGAVTIRTRVGAGAYGPARVLLEVSDTGAGMDEETCQHCLEPFFSTKGERGTGLGLAMVYGVMQRHQGDIHIQSELGQGTTIRLVFPLRKSDETAGPARSGATTPPSPLRILCIDDEPLMRELMRDALENDGHTVEVAEGGQAGLELFRAAKERDEPFEVVITDLGMPHVDGNEVARTVKHESPATPVILLTGWGNRLKTEGHLPAQVDYMLSKPPEVDCLREALAQVTRTIRSTS